MYANTRRYLSLPLIAFPLGAMAHEEAGVADGLLSGFLHPLLGLDHLVAMVAVGLLGAVMGPPAIWLLPVLFPLVMAFGGTLGVAGVSLPGIEIGVALSGIVLGLLLYWPAGVWVVRLSGASIALVGAWFLLPQ